MNKQLVEKLQRVKLLVLDNDGVMTERSVFVH